MGSARSVIIIGAGPAGLAYGYRRLSNDPELSMSILESSAQHGGHVQTKVIDGFSLELGPQAIRPDPGFLQLVDSLRLREQLVPASAHARHRWLAKGGKLIPFPTGPLQAIFSQIMPLRGKLRMLREPWIAKANIQEESVEDFVRRRMGSQCVPIVQAVVNGIYAGNISELELQSTLPFLAKAEAEHGSLLRAMLKARRKLRPQGNARAPLYSFVGGMSRLTSALATFLEDRLSTERVAVSVRRSKSEWEVTTEDGRCSCAQEVVLATPSWVSSRALKDFDPMLSADLEQIPFAPVASVYLGYRREQMGDWQDGFGFLMHPHEQQAILGAIYCNSIFPDQAPPHTCLIRVMMGGRCHQEILDAEDGQLIETTRESLRNYLDLDAEPIFSYVNKIQRAIPQYTLGHSARLRRIGKRLLDHPGLCLRGNSYHGIALGAQLSGPLSGEEAWQRR